MYLSENYKWIFLKTEELADFRSTGRNVYISILRTVLQFISLPFGVVCYIFCFYRDSGCLGTTFCFSWISIQSKVVLSLYLSFCLPILHRMKTINFLLLVRAWFRSCKRSFNSKVFSLHENWFKGVFSHVNHRVLNISWINLSKYNITK